MAEQARTVSQSPTDSEGAFAELGRILLTDEPLTAILSRVAELARNTIPGASEVSVTLIEGDRPSTVVFTGTLAVALDERQYERGFGPCLDAAVTGETITIHNTAADTTYPDFSRQCQRQGILSTMSVGLPTPQRTIGGLNVYGRTPTFSLEARQLALSYASYAGVAVANAAGFNSAVQLAEQLQRAMQSRAVIDQAKGILIGRHGCSPDEAFDLLTRASQNTNRKLRDVAQEVVDQAQQSR